MKCDLIFYLARKTSYCEKSLKKQLEKIGLELNTVTASTTPVMLGEKLIDSLSRCNLVFIIGGLGFSGKIGLTDVLSKALSTTKVTPSDIKKLKSDTGIQYGYLIRCATQTIVAFPDKPEELAQMFSPALVAYLKETYSL